jgi:ubiquinone/menaquinone biosynthesis C-methylase UbiE
MIDILKKRMKAFGKENVETILSDEKDTKLPADTVDAVLLVDVYHEFSFPREMLESMHRGLKPGGRVFLIEYRAEDPLVPIKPLHKMSQKQAKREYAAAGFRWVETHDFLPRQHFMIFEKPMPAAEVKETEVKEPTEEEKPEDPS